ncbi:NUDIX domain-containing protein [Paenibacillus sacheonensis]|uniref:NUDIX domain-containing protein n=1 Tax=Paenibacillus sacheonensis TaxID=742054 RepID=A0A7X5BXC7_9BACL|nr:NUDIX domain-containing protein [Paenibacillus sacheonensis]MBM7566125.1 ADP-ribose pyrophosphatase YjhB (NUDIX family) [Paenibacillus sacheonensis]NBC70338.1 NUDIX domain-containing protein [Paenibacillus sacheonensis]
MKIRTAARAIIIKNDKLLVLRRTGVQGEFYVLPGGGQEHGESIHESLVREVIEEVSLVVEPEKLLFINEFIAKRDSLFPDLEPDVHQIDFTFLCKVISDNEAEVGETPDLHQVGIAWIPLNEITDYRLRPANDLHFILGAPSRNALSQWITNKENVSSPLFIAG